MPRPPARNLLDDPPVTNGRGRRAVSDADLGQVRRTLRTLARLDLTPAHLRALLAQDAALTAAVLSAGGSGPQVEAAALQALAWTLLRQDWPSAADAQARAVFSERLYRAAAEAGYRLV